MVKKILHLIFYFDIRQYMHKNSITTRQMKTCNNALTFTTNFYHKNKTTVISSLFLGFSDFFLFSVIIN